MTDERPAKLEEYRHELRRLAADVERPFEGKLSEALALGCSYLDVEMAFVTRVADDIQEPVAVEGEHHIIRDGRAWPLSASYCQCVLEEGGPFETTNASNAEEIPEIAFETFEVETYLGTPVTVGADTYGTLCFADTEPRAEPFSPAQSEFVEELADWVGRELTHHAVRSELEAENEQLEHFIRTISHDLRNPLAVVRANLELLDTEYDDDRITMALGGVDETEALLEEVMAYAKGQRADRETVSLGTVARKAWETVASDAATLNVTTDAAVSARRWRLRQLFENLFENAITHAGADVTVTVAAGEDWVRVCDDGPGFPDTGEDITSAGVTTHEDGTGFGLPIVERIADAHGWTMQLTSDDGACVVLDGVEFPELEAEGSGNPE